MKLLTALFLTLILAVAGLCQTRAEYRADLVGLGKTKAVFKARGAQAELQFEGERLPRNASFTLQIGDNVWDVVTNGLGRARVTQRWSRGAPAIDQTSIALLLDENGDVVAEGPFRRRL